MDVSKWEPGLTADKHLIMNVHVVNKGKAPASKVTRQGSMLVPSVATPTPPEEIFVAIFAALHAQLSTTVTTDLTIYPDQDNVWFSVLGQEVNDTRWVSATLTGHATTPRTKAACDASWVGVAFSITETNSSKIATSNT
jgi:hypothetical protein